MLRRLPWCFLVLAVACGGGENPSGDAAIVTVFDSTTDTLLARTSGDVPAAEVRRTVVEMQIAPGMDDTTLFTRVHEFDVDRQGRLWVFDAGSASIFVFGPDGALIRRIGRKGAGPGEFQQNGGMVLLADGRLVEWDSRNARISFFDSAGTFLSSWPLPGGFSTSNGLYTDQSGALYLRRPVTEPRDGEILGRMGLVRLLDGGAYGDSLAPPDLVVPRDEYVAHVEGNTSSIAGAFSAGYHWGWLPSGEFVAADGGKYQLIIARKSGKPVVIRRELSPVSVGDDERQYEERRITHGLRYTEPDWRFTGPPIPTTKAPIQSMLISRDGRIWVRVATPSELIPEAEIELPRDSLAPIPRHRWPVEYEVFASDGRFLGRVALPINATLIEADGNQVWGLDTDENGLQAVTRWR
ncbi:MAG TPA: 6-bladed beta-propeller, partial [Gemmatimonadales bacterium]|nr:6-bladed beta-propeller [Gemmatimonadales bacterium]